MIYNKENNIKILEQISMNAWPSIQTMFYDGWILRFANGVTRRANSVNPIYESTLDVEEKIAFCEKQYSKKNLPAIFKMTSAANPSELDAVLEKKSYGKQAETSVQILDLTEADFDIFPAIKIENELDGKWVKAFVELNEFDEDKIQTYNSILENIIPRTAFAGYSISNRIIGCGLGVKQGNYIGLFDIVVDKKHRGVGLGYYIVAALMQWGKSKGATIAYLQVMTENEIALHLYEKLGFKEQYKYWYRVKKHE
ncbi:MAG: GNAT family N-acetyltransferase [Candidatus Celaenobacter polaris]|nr:GNAT family N-acetyltransferase [Candidatus Celaenobacter polaris]